MQTGALGQVFLTDGLGPAVLADGPTQGDEIGVGAQGPDVAFPPAPLDTL